MSRYSHYREEKRQGKRSECTKTVLEVSTTAIVKQQNCKISNLRILNFLINKIANRIILAEKRHNRPKSFVTPLKNATNLIQMEWNNKLKGELLRAPYYDKKYCPETSVTYGQCRTCHVCLKKNMTTMCNFDKHLEVCNPSAYDEMQKAKLKTPQKTPHKKPPQLFDIFEKLQTFKTDEEIDAEISNFVPADKYSPEHVKQVSYQAILWSLQSLLLLLLYKVLVCMKLVGKLLTVIS